MEDLDSTYPRLSCRSSVRKGHPRSQNRTPKTYRFQQKIPHCIKNRDNCKLNESNQLINANTKVTEMLELSDKYLKATIIKMLQRTMRNTFETNGKIRSCRQERQNRKKNDREILELKNTVPKTTTTTTTHLHGGAKQLSRRDAVNMEMG